MTGPAGPSKIFAYLPGARTAGPSGTRLLCLKLRGACCHLFDILVLIFSYILSVSPWGRASLLQSLVRAHRRGGASERSWIGVAAPKTNTVYRIIPEQSSAMLSHLVVN